MRSHTHRIVLAVAATALFQTPGCTSPPPPPPDPAPDVAELVEEKPPRVVEPVPPPVEAPKPPREYPFDLSPDDLAALEVAGFSGTTKAPEGTGFGLGMKVVGIMEPGAAHEAGLVDGDLIVELGGLTFPEGHADPIGALRERLKEFSPGDRTTITVVRKEEVLALTIDLGRRPPPFDQDETDPQWFVSEDVDTELEALIQEAITLDDGRERYEDTLRRNRERLGKTDTFRLEEVVEVHVNLAANEAVARRITDAIRNDPTYAVSVAAGGVSTVPPELPPEEELAAMDLPGLVDTLESVLTSAREAVERSRTGWSEEETAFFVEHLEGLTDSLSDGIYLHHDEDVARERRNRRIVKLLERVDRAAITGAVADLQYSLEVLAPHLARAARAVAEENDRGLILERDSPLGRIEIWGTGDQRHTKRCAFRLDLGGDDDYLDVGGRADIEVPVSVNVDLAGNDIYGATSPGCQGAGIGGIGILMDMAGDDRYVARHWSQGVGLAGFGLLLDAEGNDVYRSLYLCQGVGLVGAGVLRDESGDDAYTGLLYAQGVGLAGGVGAVTDLAGDDTYACTGRDQSGYGEDGLFEGWGQGCGFGFRLITSGGIGVLDDAAGNDVYEAGNFSQGGGYHYAWGILRDSSGDDRYVGSRYAQGFAAHEAVGTFLEEAGDDLYQSHSNVAQGLSWDETSVFFRDMAGNDVYQTQGFSLAAAAHNGMVIFIDDAGDDVYRAPPGQARSNSYHGGHSFSLFVDRGGGDDRYGNHPPEPWNDVVRWKQDGAYHVDLPAGSRRPLVEYVREKTDEAPK